MTGDLTQTLPTSTLVALLLAGVRAAAWLVICPPFSSRIIPGQIKALLGVAIALPVVPGLTATVPDLATGPLMASIAEQVVIGTVLGFLTALMFAAFQSAGDLIDLFGGFSIAFAFDPLSATGNSVFGRFYNLMATTLLFVTDAHQVMLRGFARSYRTLPLNATLSMSNLDTLLTKGMGQLFMSALQLAGPLVAVLFLADLGLGLLSRVAPALNVFSLGFPAKILLTLSLAGMAMLLLPQAVTEVVNQSVQAVLQAARP